MATAAQKATLEAQCTHLAYVIPRASNRTSSPRAPYSDGDLLTLTAQLALAAAPFGAGADALALQLQGAVGKQLHDKYVPGLTADPQPILDALNALLALAGLTPLPTNPMHMGGT